MELPFELETDLERRIAAEPEWRKGVEWGAPRRGHPEGAVKHHVADVLANIEREATSPEERRRLRLAALVHDAFKYVAAEGSARVAALPLYVRFFRADNATEGKNPEAVAWFEAIAARAVTQARGSAAPRASRAGSRGPERS